MKLPAVLILCSLALCGARGADSFGTKEPGAAAPNAQARALPTNEIELRKFLIGTRWAPDGNPENTFECFEDGSFKSPKFSAEFVVTSTHHMRVTWNPKLKIDCEFDGSYSEFKELGGSRGIFKRVTPTAAAADDPVSKTAQPVSTVSTPSGSVSRDLVKTYRNSLVFVTGADGAGSGFIARMNEANFLFTNDHVAAGIKGAGFKTLDGTKVTGGAAASAVGHDIFRMQLGPGGTPFEVMLKVDENAAIDDEVVVLGNAEGGGVINTIKGKIVGLGPQLVEVDAPFQPGNSGSPIVHLKTGKVIGVATYLTIKKYDAATKEVLKAPVIRRFGYRLDSVKTWQPVNWPAFYAQAAEIQAIETLTGDLDGFLTDLSKNKGRVTAGAHTNPAIKTRIDQWLAEKKKRLNPKDAATVDQNFLSFLKVACRSDTMAAQPRLTYDYFQRQLGVQQQQRGEIADIFDKIIKELQKDR